MSQQAGGGGLYLSNRQSGVSQRTSSVIDSSTAGAAGAGSGGSAGTLSGGHNHLHHQRHVTATVLGVEGGNSTLVVVRADRTHEGRYLCQTSNGVGSGLSKLVKLTVNGGFWCGRLVVSCDDGEKS